jgi:hypothetical protein
MHTHNGVMLKRAPMMARWRDKSDRHQSEQQVQKQQSTRTHDKTTSTNSSDISDSSDSSDNTRQHATTRDNTRQHATTRDKEKGECTHLVYHTNVFSSSPDADSCSTTLATMSSADMMVPTQPQSHMASQQSHTHSHSPSTLTRSETSHSQPATEGHNNSGISETDVRGYAWVPTTPTSPVHTPSHSAPPPSAPHSVVTPAATGPRARGGGTGVMACSCLGTPYPAAAER